MLDWLKTINFWNTLPAIVTTCVGLFILIPKLRQHIISPFFNYFIIAFRGPAILDEIRKQLHPNGGSSLFDKVQQLAENQEKMNASTEARVLLDDAARFWAESDGRWSSANKAFYKLFKASQQDIEGYGFRNLLSDIDAENFLDKWTKAVSLGHEFIANIHFQDTQNRELGILHIHAVPLKYRGQIFKWEGIVKSLVCMNCERI